jgi:hypothetical protein
MAVRDAVASNTSEIELAGRTCAAEFGPADIAAHGGQAAVPCVPRDCAWVLLYIERWLKVPVQMEDGSMVSRAARTPRTARLESPNDRPPAGERSRLVTPANV